ncbi:hypothetical protein SAMN02745129_2322 [Ferrimonas marina]|uniref:Uncharacterized protein n=1 Tax=Ferrimonas marina TaxID=299255 RepID=A0A1M5TXU6_9GAMM|nr:hypothetical protein SAMN02745129_2322 [Ferrimonas marina]
MLPYSDAAKLVQAKGVTSARQYKALLHWQDPIATQLPTHPADYYSRRGDWTGWDDFTHAPEPATPRRSIEQGQALARENTATNRDQWYQLALQHGFPVDPELLDGFTSWDALLGTAQALLPLEEAARLARPLGITTAREYRTRFKTRTLPAGLPSDPQKQYKTQWLALRESHHLKCPFWRYFLDGAS